MARSRTSGRTRKGKGGSAVGKRTALTPKKATTRRGIEAKGESKAGRNMSGPPVQRGGRGGTRMGETIGWNRRVPRSDLDERRAPFEPGDR